MKEGRKQVYKGKKKTITQIQNYDPKNWKAVYRNRNEISNMLKCHDRYVFCHLVNIRKKRELKEGRDTVE